jgi:hypothetical protein
MSWQRSLRCWRDEQIASRSTAVLSEFVFVGVWLVIGTIEGSRQPDPADRCIVVGPIAARAWRVSRVEG